MFSLDRLLVLVIFPVILLASQPVTRYKYGQDVHRLYQKRQISQTPVVSSLPPLANGTIPRRLEIRELEQDHEQWTLYILALDWMQYASQTEPFSWYGIAGIHGAPYVDWGGVKAMPGNEAYGYCTHISNLFPAWHRPYLALFEQTIYRTIQFIASLYQDEPTRDRFQQAAETFRIPYWDWAANPPSGKGVLPLSVGGSPAIAVDGPNGVQIIANPLYSYTFRPLNTTAFDEFPFYDWNETKRAPAPLTATNASSNNSFVAATLDHNLPSYQQRLYNLFANYGNYSTWSNEAWIQYSANGTEDSIESLHDTIHTTSGGTWGHMAIIPYSSFDPIFWLHHAMVDRVFAMWQIVYPDSYVAATEAVVPTRTITVGDVEDADSDLTPFMVNDTHFWTSNLVRNHQIFGYTYAEVANHSRTAVITAINRFYGNYNPTTMNSKAKRSMTGGHSPLIELTDGNGMYHEWMASIHVKKFALNASFSIHFFLGQVLADPRSWNTAPNSLGFLGIFATRTNNPNMRSRYVSGTVPLTLSLAKYVSAGSVRSLQPDDLRPFLQQNIGFRILMNDSVMIDADDVDGLGITVISSKVRAPQNDHELAKWGGTVSQLELYP